ncbi:MAG: DUF2283 domain-containing protein [Candidatus Bipolaricaulota bacterium]
MRITYDSRQNVAYIRLREKRAEAGTLRISDELNIDLAPDGTVYGIELLNVNGPTGHFSPAEFEEMRYPPKEAPARVAGLR